MPCRVRSRPPLQRENELAWEQYYAQQRAEEEERLRAAEDAERGRRTQAALEYQERMAEQRRAAEAQAKRRVRGGLRS